MIKFFRQSYIVQYIVLILLTLALWIPSFIDGGGDTDLTSSVTPLYNWFNHILGFSPYAKLTFAFLLMLFEALFFNFILVENQIIPRVSVMGAFVFLLLMNFTMTQTFFSPFAFATLFVLAMVHALFKVYLAQNIEIDLLNVGLFLGLTTMCYFQSIILILWVILSLIISKKTSFRFQLIPIVGFIAPYFIYFLIAFFRGDLIEVWSHYSQCFSALNLSFNGFDMWSLIAVMVVALLTIVPAMCGGSSIYEKSIAVRSKLVITGLLIAFSLFLLFTGTTALLNGLLFIALAVIMSYELSYIGNTRWANWALVLVMFLVFSNKFFFKIV